MTMLLASISQWDPQLHEYLTAHSAVLEPFVKLALAVVMGGLVGIEREIRGRQAGFRTYILVCMGSALIMIVSNSVALKPWPSQGQQGVTINIDPARIAYGVMTGIGFLGAGVIVHQKGAVRGLTTAAGLWCITAVGLAVGLGLYTVSSFTTLLILLTLWVLDYLEAFIPKLHYRTVTIRTKWCPECIPKAVKKFKGGGLKVVEAYFDRHEDMEFADIQLRIAFFKRETYYAFERQIEADPNYELMAAREV
jgi:putative Mg2+ transporter-C (MgtC) family protein